MTTTTNEVDHDNQQIDNDMEAFMNQRVAKSTRESYKRIKTTFTIWLFEQHNKFPIRMQPTLYYILQTKNLEYISRMKTQGKRSKSIYGI